MEALFEPLIWLGLATGRRFTLVRRLPLRRQIPLVWFDGLGLRNIVKVPQPPQHSYVFRTEGSKAIRIGKVVRKPYVEIISRFDFFNILGGELEGEGVHVGFEMFDLSTTDDGEYVRSLEITTSGTATNCA